MQHNPRFKRKMDGVALNNLSKKHDPKICF